MSDPSSEVQAAIVAKLKAPGTLPGVIGARVYDSVPEMAPYPYISLGEGQVLPDKADCIDGSEVYVQIDVWSQAVGFPEAKSIAKAVMGALDDQPLAVEGFDTVVFEHQTTNYLRDPDGKTRHAAMTFRGLFNPL